MVRIFPILVPFNNNNRVIRRKMNQNNEVYSIKKEYIRIFITDLKIQSLSPMPVRIYNICASVSVPIARLNYQGKSQNSRRNKSISRDRKDYLRIKDELVGQKVWDNFKPQDLR